MPKPPQVLNEISSLLQIVADLRGPNGCPWDKEQTHLTLAKYAIEETFEMVEAIEGQSDLELCEELGDVLFQVVLHSQLANERKAFAFQDVVQSISEKIVRRHPHVFAEIDPGSTADVIRRWDEIKAEEKKLKALRSAAKKPNPNTASALGFEPLETPKGLPALQTADKIGEKTERLDFDWSHAKDVIRHLKLEIAELEEALDESVSPEAFEHIHHELGDVLFTMAQLCRKLKVDPEYALRDMNRRFRKRFSKIVELSWQENQLQPGILNSSPEQILQHFKSLDRNKKEKLWDQAKKQLGQLDESNE